MLLARNQVGTREITMGISLEITMEGHRGDYYGDQPGDYYGDQPGDYYGESAWRLLWGVSLEITMGELGRTCAVNLR